MNECSETGHKMGAVNVCSYTRKCEKKSISGTSVEAHVSVY